MCCKNAFLWFDAGYNFTILKGQSSISGPTSFGIWDTIINWLIIITECLIPKMLYPIIPIMQLNSTCLCSEYSQHQTKIMQSLSNKTVVFKKKPRYMILSLWHHQGLFSRTEAPLGVFKSKTIEAKDVVWWCHEEAWDHRPPVQIIICLTDSGRIIYICGHVLQFHSRHAQSRSPTSSLTLLMK